MKMTERPGLTLPAHDAKHVLRQVGRKGRGHLVEEQDVRLDGQGAGEVHDAQDRQGHLTRPWRARSRPSMPSVRTHSMNASTGVSVRRRLERTSRSGMSAGSW